MSEEADQPVALRPRSRLTSDHIPRIVDLSLLTIQNRAAVTETSSLGADKALTPSDAADVAEADVADVPGSADGACERSGTDVEEDSVLLRFVDENEDPDVARARTGSRSRPSKMSVSFDHQSRRRSLPLKRLSEPTELFWRSSETEHMVKRHSGPEGVLRRRSAYADVPPHRSVVELMLRFIGVGHGAGTDTTPPPSPSSPPAPPPPPPPSSILELPLRRRGQRGISSDSDSSDASFHTALDSPMCESPQLRAPRVGQVAEPARARQSRLAGEFETKSAPGSPATARGGTAAASGAGAPAGGEVAKAQSAAAKRGEQQWRIEEPEPPGAEEPARQRAFSWRLAAGQQGVSVRARIGQIERELDVLARRPGAAARHPTFAQPSSRWYSNQNEDDHVYFFKEGSNSSTWTLPSAENGASQTARGADSTGTGPRVAPIGGVPSVLQVARGQRGRSLVFPPPPATEPPPQVQLISGNQTHLILNQGILNHTKLAKETSWRARKSWAPCRVVLTDRSLFLFKDTRVNAGMPSQLGRAGHRPDTTVDLAGAFVDWDSEASSRKNVFQIRTVRGLRLLLQDDDSLTATRWFDVIKRAIAGVPSSTNQLSVPRQLTADDRLTRSRSVRFTAGSGSQEDLSRDSSTIRDRLRRFFRARPPADSLVSRGILKDEPVFGGHLAALCAIEGSTVPRFVVECVSAIEAKPEHMKMDGVYRASGNLSQVQRIRCEVDQDNYQVLYDEEDVHVLTGALKLFFRELKEPLIPFAVLPEALRAAGLTSRPEQVAAFRKMVTALPAPNRDTLSVLLAHLARVTELQEFNRMHAHNLAIVFGPTLMWEKRESPDLALDLMRQNRVVEALLELRTEVFASAA